METTRIEAPFAAEFPLPFRVVLLGGLGILCWATNLHGLNLLGIDVAGALELRPQDVGFMSSPRLTVPPRAQGDAQALARAVYRLFFAYATWTFFVWLLFLACSHDSQSFVDSCKIIPAASMLCIVIGAIFPLRVLQRHVRDQFLLAIRRCCTSPLGTPIYFSDVVLADIMTSFAKVIGDIWLSIRMFWPSGSLLVFPSQDGWQGMVVPFLMSIPYFIRFRQCVVEYLLPTNTSKRPMWNALKYASSFPVIFLSAAQRTVANDIAIEKGTFEPGEHPLFRLWLLSVAVNSLYSFWWDVTNDWGLELLRPKSKVAVRHAPRQLVLPTLHPQGVVPGASSTSHPRSPSQKRAVLDGDEDSDSSRSRQIDKLNYPWFLRPTLLFPRPIYPIVILLNLILRLTWSVKLSSHLHHHSSSLGGDSEDSSFYVPGAAVIFWIEVAELLRRWVWVFFRVEWECVKKREQEQEFAPEVGDLELEGLGLGLQDVREGDRLRLNTAQQSGEVVFDGDEKTSAQQ